MAVKDSAAVRAGRAREYAKIALRSTLYRRNLDLVRNPFPVRVATTLAWLGADAVLDIGANVGQYGSALRSSGYRGRVVSCEPLPDAYEALTRRATGDERWAHVCTAVGAEPGTLDINVSANSYSSSILPMTAAHLGAAPGSKFVATRQVPVTTVADLVRQHDVDPTRTLLKIDTQGYEAPVLDGAGDLLAKFAAIQLELSLVPLYAGQQLADALTDRLTGLGFALYTLEGGFGDERTGRMLQYDGLFVRGDLLPAESGEHQ
jgi:FkbM family methyltransferase